MIKEGPDGEMESEWVYESLQDESQLDVLDKNVFWLGMYIALYKTLLCLHALKDCPEEQVCSFGVHSLVTEFKRFTSVPCCHRQFCVSEENAEHQTIGISRLHLFKRPYQLCGDPENLVLSFRGILR